MHNMFPGHGDAIAAVALPTSDSVSAADAAQPHVGRRWRWPVLQLSPRTVAGVLVDTARVEVDYIRATGQDTSYFIDSLKTPKAQAAITNAPTGKVDRSTPGVTRHTMGDD